MDAIVVDGLRVVRGGRVVLPELSCKVASGRVTGLLGPSGSGKSTLIRAIVGVQRVAGGTVTVLGAHAGSTALRSRVGYMTQAPSVYRDLTVRENLRFFARVLDVPRTAVERVIEEVSLADYADAVVGSPDLLVLDEPTVGLDPVLRRDLWQLFHDLGEAGKTLLVSSHVMDEADRCDSLLLLRDGRILAAATPQELKDRTGADGLDDAFLRLIEEPGT